MKKCKCIKDYYYDYVLLYKADNKLHIYNYERYSMVHVNYEDNVCVFTLNKESEENDYFYEYFLDITEERKLKLLKINNI